MHVCSQKPKNPHIALIRKKQNTNTKEMGTTQRYEIVREVMEPPTNTHKFLQTNPTLTLNYFVPLLFQDIDQDMANSSSPTTNKRGQLTIYQPTQQKKKKHDL
jgi:hypothetical protein